MSSVTEEELFRLTDCEHLDDIRVISLKDKQCKQCLKVLQGCANLTILYLQNNCLLPKDLAYLQTFSNLKKIDLSGNQLEALPTG